MQGKLGLDSNLVSDLLSSTERGGGSTPAPFLTYTEKFFELFPYYLSLGMSEEQYWDRDCNLVIYYRKSEEIKSNRRNQEMWLQGAYFYDALCRVSPLYHSFSKKALKAHPYVAEPYALNDKQAELVKEEKAKKTFDKGIKMMSGFMTRHNQRFER